MEIITLAIPHPFDELYKSHYGCLTDTIYLNFIHSKLRIPSQTSQSLNVRTYIVSMIVAILKQYHLSAKLQYYAIRACDCPLPIEVLLHGQIKHEAMLPTHWIHIITKYSLMFHCTDQIECLRIWSAWMLRKSISTAPVLQFQGHLIEDGYWH